jgi:anti-anti-sigma regulatory factor
MKVKIDTKEKMYVITLQEDKLTANMTEELDKLLLDYLKQSPANVIVNFRQVNEMELEIAKLLTVAQQRFYDENHSLVYCHFKPGVADFLDSVDVLEVLNVTPTESEASDIVQMEEIEREYL